MDCAGSIATPHSAYADANNSRHRPRNPHIIMVVGDDIGLGDVGFMGSGASYVQTPYLNSLAQNGTVLTKYYVQPTCSPTRAALLTGKASIHTGVYLVCCAPYTMQALPCARGQRGTNGECENLDSSCRCRNGVGNMPVLPELLRPFNYTSHAVRWYLVWLFCCFRDLCTFLVYCGCG